MVLPFIRYDTRPTTPQAFGSPLIGDGILVTDGAVSIGSHNLDCASSNPFKPTDVGKLVNVVGGVDTVNTLPDLATTIASYVSPSRVTMTQAAGANLTNANIAFGTDCTAAFAGAVLSDYPIDVPGLVYLFSGPVAMRSGLRMNFSPNALIVSSNPTGGVTPTASIFSAVQGTTLSSTTLTADTVLGSKVIHVAAAVSKGATIVLTAASNYATSYDVVSASGGGLVLTLDRPVQFKASSGATVTVVSDVVRDVELHLNGAGLSGVAVRYLEFLMARDCVITGASCNPAWGRCSDAMASWDTGSYNCVWQRCVFDGMNFASMGGVTLESPENCGPEDCVIKNVVPTNGILAVQAVKCFSRGTTSTGNLSGIRFDSSNAGATPCLDFEITGGHYDSNSGAGLDVVYCEGLRGANFSAEMNGGYGAQFAGTIGNDNALSNVQAKNNTNGGYISLAGGGSVSLANFDGSGTVQGVTANAPIQGSNLVTRSCSVAGVLLFAGADGSAVHGCDVSACNATAVLANCDSEFSGVRGVLTAPASNFTFIVSAACTVRLSHSYFSSGVVGNGIACIATGAAGARIYVDGVRCKLGTNSHGLYLQDPSSVIYLDDFEASKIGAATGTTGVNGTSGIVRIGQGVNVDKCNVTYNAAITLNQGTFTANGTTNVNVPFADMLSTDIVEITSMKTPGGVAAGMPVLVSKTPGTGFAVKAPVGTDTGDYYWRIAS